MDASFNTDRPDCIAFRQSWQAHMDGAALAETVHARECLACAEFLAAGERLKAGLALTRPEPTSPERVDRLVAAIDGAARWNGVRSLAASVAGFAIAASVALVVLFAVPRQPSDDQPKQLVSAEVLPLPRVREPPEVDVFAQLPSFEELTTNPLEKLEPVVLAIENIGQDAVSTMSPLANSAKRTADLFWKGLIAKSDPKFRVN
jgi:hypothetical protein